MERRKGEKGRIVYSYMYLEIIVYILSPSSTCILCIVLVYDTRQIREIREIREEEEEEEEEEEGWSEGERGMGEKGVLLLKNKDLKNKVEEMKKKAREREDSRFFLFPSFSASFSIYPPSEFMQLFFFFL